MPTPRERATRGTMRPLRDLYDDELGALIRLGAITGLFAPDLSYSVDGLADLATRESAYREGERDGA